MLVEVLTVIALLGSFLLLAGPLTLHLIRATGRQTKIHDQLFLVSQVSDKIRSDLKGPSARTTRLVTVVESNRISIRAHAKTIEYRTDHNQIERIETLGGIARTTAVWKIPYTALTFSNQPGKPGAVLVELHWSLERPGTRRTHTRKLPIEMAFAAAQLPPAPVNKEEN